MGGNDKKLKLNYPQTIKVGIAFAIIMVFWTAYDFVMPLLLEHAYGLDNKMRGLIMGLDNLLSLFLLPVFGKLSDKSEGKLAKRYGKRTPFIFIGTIVSAILMIFVPISSHSSLGKGMEIRQDIVKELNDEGKMNELLNKFYGDRKYCDTTYLKINKIEKDDYLKIRYDANLVNEKLKGVEKKQYGKKAYKYKNPQGDDVRYKDPSGKEIVVAKSGTIVDVNGSIVTKKGEKKIADIIKGNEDYKKYVESGMNVYISEQIWNGVQHDKKSKIMLGIYMVILLIVLVAMASFRSPAVALMPDVTPKPLRSQANAMINLMGGVGGAIAFLIYTIALIKPAQFFTYTIIFSAVAIAMLALLCFFIGFVREPKLKDSYLKTCEEFGITDEDIEKEELEKIKEEPGDDRTISLTKKIEEKFYSKMKGLSEEEKKKKLEKAKLLSFILILGSIFMWFMGFNAVSSNISIYCVKELNLRPVVAAAIVGVSMGISAIAFIPVGIMATRIGRRKSIIVGFICATIAFLLIFIPIIKKASEKGGASGDAIKATLFALFYLVASFGLIIANVNTFPMVVELSSEGSIGKYTGYYYAATMSAQAITPFIAGAVMDKFGSKFLFLYSAICVFIAIIIMLFVRYGDGVILKKGKKLTKEEKKEVLLESMGDAD